MALLIMCQVEKVSYHWYPHQNLSTATRAVVRGHTLSVAALHLLCSVRLTASEKFMSVCIFHLILYKLHKTSIAILIKSKDFSNQY